MKEVVILGCGPAGLLAAHAAVRRGYKPVIYSRKIKSQIGGAQFLHREIDGVTGPKPDGVIDLRYVGGREGYAMKVYGDRQAPVSWGNYPAGPNDIWDLRMAYDVLWDAYNDMIMDHNLNVRSMEDIVLAFESVVSTVPLQSICMEIDGMHVFRKQDVWIQRKGELPDMTLEYNGDIHTPWYRSSTIFGTSGLEFSYPVDNAVKISKPLWTNCDCWRSVLKLGRYGAWKKNALVHHAYEGVLSAL